MAVGMNVEFNIILFQQGRAKHVRAFQCGNQLPVSVSPVFLCGFSPVCVFVDLLVRYAVYQYVSYGRLCIEFIFAQANNSIQSLILLALGFFFCMQLFY